jgi:hypothetical protein
MMKQSKIVRKIYEACLDHDTEKLHKLRMEEFRKIIKRKSSCKPFTHKWVVVQL